MNVTLHVVTQHLLLIHVTKWAVFCVTGLQNGGASAGVAFIITQHLVLIHVLYCV